MKDIKVILTTHKKTGDEILYFLTAGKVYGFFCTAEEAEDPEGFLESLTEPLSWYVETSNDFLKDMHSLDHEVVDIEIEV